MRMASSMTAEPAPLSVAPVPPCQESKCPPSMDNFVGFGFVGAGNFANDVEGHQIVVPELALDIELHGDGNFLVQHTVDAAVVFASYGDARRSRRIFLFVAAASLLDENGSSSLREGSIHAATPSSTRNF